jgi:flagellar motor switch protein FliN
MPSPDAVNLPQGEPDATSPDEPADGQQDAASAPAGAGVSAKNASSPDDTASADDAAAGLPDWAVKKMQELDHADSNSPAEQDAPAPDAPLEAPSAPAMDIGSAPDGPLVSEDLKDTAPNLDLMLDLPLDVTVELGRAELPLAHVLALNTGAVIQLDRLPGEPLDLLVNGRLVARGEIVVLNDTFAFRITDLIES